MADAAAGRAGRQDLPYARRSAQIWSAVIWRASGHGKSELRAAAWRLRNSDRAAMGLDQALDDEQAEAGPAAALGAPELAEHPGRELGRDPGPWSRTETATPGPPWTSADSITVVTVPAPCLTAFSIRFARIWSILSASSQVSGSPSATSISNRLAASPAATRPATIFAARAPMSTSSGAARTRPASILETSSNSVISRVTRSASALTVSSMVRFWSSVNRGHFASNVAVNPFTLVSGERSS